MLVLATSLTNIDGPDSPWVGYDRAVADALRFSVSTPVRQPPPLVPPAAIVLRHGTVVVVNGHAVLGLHLAVVRFGFPVIGVDPPLYLLLGLPTETTC